MMEMEIVNILFYRTSLNTAIFSAGYRPANTGLAIHPLAKKTLHPRKEKPKMFRQFLHGARSTKTPAEPNRFRKLMAEHGPAAMLTYSAVSAASIGFCYVAVSSGVFERVKCQLLGAWTATNVEVQTAFTQSIKDAEAAVIRGIGSAEKGILLGIEQAEVAIKERSEAIKEGLHNTEEAIKEGIHHTEVAIKEGIHNTEEAIKEGISNTRTAVEHMGFSDVDREESLLSGHGATIAAVWVAHNVMFPVRLGLTAVLTPVVASKMKGSRLDVLIRRVTLAGQTKLGDTRVLVSKYVGLRK
ncbi:hypothetical protein BJ741DRAFT_333086 [Chytriomyces cf. hyalinus JEL632]|nr:hypothetical protein BJ741DRAFT_333086 [Chytriomyces cf. hyalinus JEL632]